EAPHGGARPRHEGAGILRRVLQCHAPVVRRRSLFLLLPYGGSGNRRNGAGEAVPFCVARGPVSLACERGSAAALWQSREVRSLPAVRPGDQLRTPGRLAPRPALHHLQGERGRWQTPLIL